MRPFSERTEFSPGEHFLEDMAAYSGEAREECEAIPSELNRPDYRILSRAQLDYYFYWRSRLAEGDLPLVDEGYMWLRMCEIVNLDIDPDQGLKELMTMLDKGGYKRVRDTVTVTLIDWCLEHDLPIPPIWIWGWDKRVDIVTTSIMSPAPDYLPLATIRRMGKVEELYYTDEDGLERMCNAVVQALDRHLIMTTGRGMLETYSRRVSGIFPAYTGLVLAEDRALNVSYLEPNADFSTIMRSVIRYSEKILLKRIGYEGPRCPSLFTNSYRKVADDASMLMGHDDMPAILPKSELLQKAERVSRRERMLIEVGDSLSSEGYEGRVIEDITAMPTPVTSRFRGVLAKIGKMSHPYPERYIPSGTTNFIPYPEDDDERLRYYLRWRDYAKDGEYMDTDRGYIWLFLCELINSDSDETSTVASLARAYERGDERPFIGTTYLDLLLVRGRRDADPTVFRSGMTMNLAIDNVFSEDWKPLDLETLSYATGMKTYTALRQFDDVCMQTLMLSLREIDRRRSIIATCGVRYRRYSDRAFKRLRYYGDLPQQFDVEFPDYLSNDAFCDGLKALVKCTMQSVKKVCGSKAAVTRTEEFGMLCNPIVEECARNAVASPSTMGARKVSIDMTAVVRAEDDLRSVTAMMATEDAEEPEEEAPAPTGSARADDPWTALSAMLDEDERGYLSSALEGNGRRYGPKASRLEDSINGKAMDAMGDSIVEDGAVVPDYIDDVRRMLR